MKTTAIYLNILPTFGFIRTATTKLTDKLAQYIPSTEFSFNIVKKVLK